MNFKSKNFLIPVISILILSIGFGAFLGRFYFTAKNLEIDIEKMDKIEVNIGGTLLNPTYDIDIDLQGTIKSITAINISVDSISYFMEIDGKNFGPGTIDSFKASQNPTPLIIHHYGKDLGRDQNSVILDFILGEDVTVEITLLTITMMGFTYDLNSVSSFIVNVDDL